MTVPRRTVPFTSCLVVLLTGVLSAAQPPAPDPSPVSPGDGQPETTASEAAPPADQRDAFAASAYLGYAFDNFAPGSIGGYQNGAASGAEQHRRVAGVNFEFHVAGAGARQLWIFGETLNGVRAADIECVGENAPVVCGQLTENQGEQFRYILQNATSKEALVGIRLELLRLNADSEFATRFYVTGQLGVMMLRGDLIGATSTLIAQEAYRAHHFGTGLLIESGPYGGSYLEFGWGRTDLFGNTERRPDGRFVELQPWRRLKIDAFLSFELPGSDRLPRPFVQLFSDFDPTDKTSDSMQTFLGFDLDLGGLFQVRVGPAGAVDAGLAARGRRGVTA
jgi:hypothetical protein